MWVKMPQRRACARGHGALACCPPVCDGDLAARAPRRHRGLRPRGPPAVPAVLVQPCGQPRRLAIGADPAGSPGHGPGAGGPDAPARGRERDLKSPGKTRTAPRMGVCTSSREFLLLSVYAFGVLVPYAIRSYLPKLHEHPLDLFLGYAMIDCK